MTTATDHTKDKLYFYSKSADKPKPGKGTNEVVEDPDKYAELAKIVGWRKVLSNFHFCPFKFEGKTYNTIEHVFQAKKIALEDPVKADTFTVESGTDLGKGDGALAQKNRKLIKLSKTSLAKWDDMKDKVMKDAAVAKYKACPEARTVLQHTQNAELWHIVMRKQPTRFVHLEEIRQK
jgi:predicted NAD-dependent protein-ADP-ribosyltransferase YbiA (DUF1768 family)